MRSIVLLLVSSLTLFACANETVSSGSSAKNRRAAETVADDEGDEVADTSEGERTPDAVVAGPFSEENGLETEPTAEPTPAPTPEPAPTPTPSPTPTPNPTPTPTPTPTPPPAALPTAETTGDLYLRSGPGTSYASILVMPKGSTVTLLGTTTNSFSKVRYNGQEGWAGMSYLRAL